MGKINLRIKLNKNIQKLVDTLFGRPADIIMTAIYAILGLSAVYSIFNIIKMTRDPLADSNNPSLVALFLVISLFGFYFSQLGEYYKKPSRRVTQYVIITLVISIYSFNYLSITFNSLMIDVLGKIKNIDIIPPELLVGNIRVATTLIPAAIILPVFVLSLDAVKNEKSKGMIRSYE